MPTDSWMSQQLPGLPGEAQVSSGEAAATLFVGNLEYPENWPLRSMLATSLEGAGQERLATLEAASAFPHAPVIRGAGDGVNWIQQVEPYSPQPQGPHGC